MVVILFLHLIAPDRSFLATEQSGVRILICIFYISICYIMCLFLIKDTASRKKRNDFANYTLSYIAVILIISVEAHILDLLLTRAGNNVNSNLLIIASIVIAVILVTIIVANSVSENEKRLNQEKDRLLERKELELLNAKQVSETYETLRMWRHDTKNHLMIMKELVMNKDYDSLKKYLNAAEEKVSSALITVDTKNPALDATLSNKLSQAKSMGIDVDYSFIIPTNMRFSDIDLCSIVSNLFDNAIEATSKTDNKKIEFTIAPIKNMLHIYISNTCNGNYEYDSNISNTGKFVSTKKDKKNHGLGLESIKTIVDKYQGQMEVFPDRNSFYVNVLLFIGE